MAMLKRFTPLGVNLDVDAVDLPDGIYTETANMVPRVGGMERALGYQETLPTPLFPPYFIMSTPQLGAPWWIYAGSLNIGVISSTGTHTDVTPPELTIPTDENEWNGGNLNGIAVLNSIKNGPFYWYDGIVGALAEPLPGMRTSTAYRIVRPFKYHLIGLGVSEPAGDFPDAVHWSNAANPGNVPDTWVPAADNEAGDNFLADERGAIVDGLALRDAFYIYKQDSVYEMTYIGGTSVFRFRKVFGTVGALAANCIVRVKGTHVVLGNGDIYQHDGQNQKSIIEGKLRDAFFSTIDDANFQNSFAVYLEPREEVWFCVPVTGESRPRLALVWHVTTGEFGYRTLPDSDFAAAGVVGEVPGLEVWDDDNGQWNQDTTVWFDQTISQTEDAIIIADAVKQKFFLANSTNQEDGEDYLARVAKLGMALDNPGREKAIRRVWPRINAPEGTNFTMTLLNQRDPMAGPELLAQVPFVPGFNGVAVNVNARYLGLRIECAEPVSWDISGFDVEYMERGKF